MTYTIVPEITNNISKKDIISTAYAYLKMLDSISLTKSNTAEVRDTAHRLYQSIQLHFADAIIEDFIWPLSTGRTTDILIDYMFPLENDELIANASEFINNIK